MIRYRIVEQANDYGEQRFVIEHKRLWLYWVLTEMIDVDGITKRCVFSTLKEAYDVLHELLVSKARESWRTRKVYDNGPVMPG